MALNATITISLTGAQEAYAVNLIELAVAGNAAAIVSHNVRDVARGELLWKSLRVLTPAHCLEELL